MSEVTIPSVLLVEDSEDDAFFFKREFAKSRVGWTLRHAPNGRAAVDLIRETLVPEDLPQMVFLDLKMPVMNGFEVLRWLTTQSFGRALPVLVLSGSEHKEDKNRAYDLGAVGYFIKPITGVDLRRIIGELFPHSKSAQEDLAAHQ